MRAGQVVSGDFAVEKLLRAQGAALVLVGVGVYTWGDNQARKRASMAPKPTEGEPAAAPPP